MARYRKVTPSSHPAGFEKSSELLVVQCTATEKERWFRALGRGRVSDAVRRYLNREADRAEGTRRV